MRLFLFIFLLFGRGLLLCIELGGCLARWIGFEFFRFICGNKLKSLLGRLEMDVLEYYSTVVYERKNAVFECAKSVCFVFQTRNALFQKVSFCWIFAGVREMCCRRCFLWSYTWKQLFSKLVFFIHRSTFAYIFDYKSFLLFHKYAQKFQPFFFHTP